MRLLIVSQYFYPETFRVNDLAETLRQRGNDLAVLTAQPNYPNGHLFDGYSNWTRWRDDYRGLELMRVPIWPRGKGRSYQLALNYLSFVFSAIVFGLPRVLLRKKFDVALVFATSPITAAIPAIVLKLLRGTKVVVWIQDLWPESVASVGAVRSPRVFGLIGGIVRWIYRRSDILLIQSNGFRESVQRWGARPDQLVYLPNWAEDIFFPLPAADTGERLKILFAGNLGLAQSLDVLVAAAERTKDVANIEWHVMGDGRLKEWLKGQQASRSLTNLTLHPRRPLEEMPAVYANYDLLLVLLKRDDHLKLVLPSKVQAAMAAGKPVLASADGETLRVVAESACGWITEPGDAKALAEEAKRLARLPKAELHRRGLAGHSYYQSHFLKSVLIRRLEEICGQLARGEKRQ